MIGSGLGKEKRKSDQGRGNGIFKGKRDCVQFKELQGEFKRLTR